MRPRHMTHMDVGNAVFAGAKNYPYILYIAALSHPCDRGIPYILYIKSPRLQAFLGLNRQQQRYRLSTFSPREMPETPVRTTSRILLLSTTLMKASSLSLEPASCTVYTELLTSIT